MTYTHKLARRLAISRKLGMLAAFALLAACAGDTTSPEAPLGPSAPSAPTPSAPFGFRVLPVSVTVEVHQSVRFRGELRVARAGLRLPPIRWEATGGTITTDGTFSAARPGTYQIIGRSRIQRPDTSMVVVVPRQPKVERVRVTPRTPELAVGRKRTFTAVGHLPDGTHTAIRVNWSATGGGISEAGVYVAGDTPGTYRVVARSLRGSHADTIPVVIRKRSRERDAVATRVVLRPASATLSPSSSLQLAAFGRTQDGDSIAVDVTFKATGGTISETGLYTAGQTPGTFRVIAKADKLEDTSVVTLAETSGGGTPEPEPSPAPSPSGGGTLSGIPFGHFNEPMPGSPLRSGGYLVIPRGDLAQLPLIRARGGQVVVNVTGSGSCAKDAAGQFRYDLWAACWSKYLTPNKARLLAYADSGVVVGTYLIDEPNLLKRWGTITPAQVCDMARFAKTELPGIPVIVRVGASWVGDCPAIDAVWGQYGSRRRVAVEDYRRAQIADAKARGYAMIFSLNALNDDGAGTPMTPQQVYDYGTVLLGPDICLFFVWQYAVPWSERPEIRAALDSLGRIAASLPRRECRRP
jgi:hypothetical protein